MNIADFVNGLADNPESGIVHEEEWDAEHGPTVYEVTITVAHTYRIEADSPWEAENIAVRRWGSGDGGARETDSIRSIML